MADKQYKLLQQQDFTGGLNFRADQFSLAANESPDLLNIDVDPRGGVKLRNGVEAHNSSATANTITNVWEHHETGGTSQIMVSHGNKVAYSTSGSFTDVIGGGGQPAANSVTTLSRGVTFNNINYSQNGTDQPLKWDGGTASRLTQSFNDSLTPAGGNMPIATHVAVWAEHVWVADTTESGVGYPSRLRWSHTDQAEDWNSDHYVDVNVGEHGDRITALVPFGDRLLVFKQNSVHAIYGFDTESFQLVTLTNDIGARMNTNPVVSRLGVFFWFAEQGVYVYNDNGFAWVFEKIVPAVKDGSIGLTNPPSLMWGENRLYVSVDWGSDRRVFVFDPTLAKGGSWVVHDIDVNALFRHRPPNAAHVMFGVKGGRLIKLEQSRTSDSYDGSGTTHISSHYRTSWFDAKMPTVRKRWGRPRTVVLADASITLPFKVYSDYDMADVHRSFDAVIAGRSSTSIWGAGGGAATWQDAEGTQGNGVWASPAEDSATDIQKHPTLGTASSISVKVEGPTTNNTWELNALTLTYMVRRLR